MSDLARAYMSDPDYTKKRRDAKKEFSELLLPLSAAALAAAGLYKGVQWARGLPLADPAGVKSIQDILAHTGQIGKASDKDIMYQLAKSFERNFK